MKLVKSILACGLVCLGLGTPIMVFSQAKPVSIKPQPMRLWYKQPARQTDSIPYGPNKQIGTWDGGKNGWREALPVGNGRLGAMVFGGVFHERIQLNEETLWGGMPQKSDNPESGKYLPEVQRLLFAGKNDEANELGLKHVLGIPKSIKSYQPLGDLFLDMQSTGPRSSFTQYSRSLSLDSAVATTRFMYQGKTYKREIFASHPAQVIVIRLTCSQPGSINTQLTMLRERDAQAVAGNQPALLILRGQIMDVTEPANSKAGMRFETHVKAINKGGTVQQENGHMVVKEADEVVFLVAAGTNYQGKDPAATCRQYVDKAAQKNYTQLFREHLLDYQKLYNRVAIKLGPNTNAAEMATDERQARMKQTRQDPYLSELVFQYGRYLTITSSRPGDLPANLQGLWNQHLSAPWNSDYHTNINLQMNYWPVEVANLAECHQPLFALMDSLVKNGTVTAKTTYKARGWVVHHLTDVFWRTAPADGAHGIWPMGGAWLARHPWEHYQYSGDKVYLKNKAYPLMKGAAEFMLDFLVKVPEGLPFAGRLVTNPSHSPENAFEKPDGTQSMFTYGATMDIQIIQDLFTNCIAATDALSTPGKPFDPAFKKELQTALARLVPVRISPRTGKIQEWIEDYKEPELGHRHLSHVYSVYPASQISTTVTPELVQAAIKTIEARLRGNPNAAVEEAKNRYKSWDSYLNGEGGGNWQRAWLACLWARLGNSAQAYDSHYKQVAKILMPNLLGDVMQQIDGNFGATAAMAEMLLQSHAGQIQLLPSLPAEWNNGAVKGLRARGGYEIDMAWQAGNLTQTTLKSTVGGTCRIKSNQKITKIIAGTQNIAFTNLPNGTLTFNTKPCRVYQLLF